MIGSNRTGVATRTARDSETNGFGGGSGTEITGAIITESTLFDVTVDDVESADIAEVVTGENLLDAKEIAAANYLKLMVPALTSFMRVPPPIRGAGDVAAVGNLAVTGDANQNGGGITPASGHYYGFTTSVVQAPASTPFGIWFRGKLVNANRGHFGLQGLLGTDYVLIGNASNINATKWVLEWGKTGGVDVVEPSAVNSDGNEHDFFLYFDGTTVTMDVDQTPVATNTDLTNMPTAKALIAAFNVTTAGAIVKRIVYGV